MSKPSEIDQIFFLIIADMIDFVDGKLKLVLLKVMPSILIANLLENLLSDLYDVAWRMQVVWFRNTSCVRLEP